MQINALKRASDGGDNQKMIAALIASYSAPIIITPPASELAKQHENEHSLPPNQSQYRLEKERILLAARYRFEAAGFVGGELEQEMSTFLLPCQKRTFCSSDALTF